MNGAFAACRFPLLSVFLVGAVAPQAYSQLSGTYRSAPGTLALYEYHHSDYESVLLPAEVTVRFSDDNPTSMLTATIHKPIIGDTAGPFNYGIVHEFPMLVTGTSTDGRTFHGDLLGTQYLFEWTFEPAPGGKLFWEGHVGWAGGRYELSTIADAQLIPVVPGDYNQNGTVDAADYVVWRKTFGQQEIGLAADGDGNHQVDADDYGVWRSHFGENSSGATLAFDAIPEPATTCLALLASMIVVAFSRAIPRRC